jgi:hypothetical protein
MTNMGLRHLGAQWVVYDIQVKKSLKYSLCRYDYDNYYLTFSLAWTIF